jgi:hypothetical protein
LLLSLKVSSLLKPAGIVKYGRPITTQPIVDVFNELLTAAQKLAPRPGALNAIKPLKVRVSATTLLMLVDQMLVALDS